MLKTMVAILLVSCGAEIKVQDSEHRIIFELCDKEAFPEPEARRRCVEQVLDLLD